MKDQFIRAYMYSYGSSKKEALQEYKKCIASGNMGFISALIAGYQAECKKAFYED